MTRFNSTFRNKAMNYINNFSNNFIYNNNIFKNVLLGGLCGIGLSIGIIKGLQKFINPLPISSQAADEATQADIKEKAKKLSILKPVKVSILPDDKNWEDAYSKGGIPFFAEAEIGIKPDTNDFVKYHELSHIAYNHDLKKIIIAEIAALSTVCLLLIKPWPVAAENVILAKLIMTAVNRFFEKQADMTAVQHAPMEDIAKVISMIEKERLECKFNRELGNISKLNISSQGNLQYAGFPDIFDDHPLYTTRMNYLSEYFYNSERKFPLSAFLYSETNKKEDAIILSKKSITKIRSLIFESSRRISWIGLNKILFFQETNKVEIYFADQEDGISINHELNHYDFAKESTVVDVIIQLLKRPNVFGIKWQENCSVDEANIENIKAKLQDQFIISQINYKNYLKEGHECSDITLNLSEKSTPELWVSPILSFI